MISSPVNFDKKGKPMWHLAIFVVAVPAVIAAGAATPRAGEKQPACAIRVSEPRGWWLSINIDGSGRLGFGSSAMDSWKFKAGTFEVEKVTKALRGVATDEKGKMGSHYVFSFESERRGPEKPGPARYTKASKVIAALFQRAKESGHVMESPRGALLWDQHTPGLSKER